MSEKDLDFPPCAVCAADDWRPVYRGRIRDGAFGSWREAEVCRCGACGVERLPESECLQIDSYQSSEYRERLEQNHNIEHHYAAHDELARFTLEALWPMSLRGKTVADVGCGGGVLLDHVRGLVDTVIAIDPALPFAESLRARGYHWFPNASEALEKYGGQVDVVLSTQVIEHVDDPRQFLADIGLLLKPEGVAVVSTPNRRDILMELLPDTFPSFFYRVQHRWAFDAASFTSCAERAGLAVAEIRHLHRYGLANTMYWLKEGRPRGRAPMTPLDPSVDKMWQAWLENSGRADTLYAFLKRA